MTDPFDRPALARSRTFDFTQEPKTQRFTPDSRATINGVEPLPGEGYVDYIDRATRTLTRPKPVESGAGYWLGIVILIWAFGFIAGALVA